jgi:hypothetical protein
MNESFTQFIEYATLAKLAEGNGKSSVDQLSVDVKTMETSSEAPDNHPLWFQIKGNYWCKMYWLRTIFTKVCLCEYNYPFDSVRGPIWHNMKLKECDLMQ